MTATAAATDAAKAGDDADGLKIFDRSVLTNLGNPGYPTLAFPDHAVMLQRALGQVSPGNH